VTNPGKEETISLCCLLRYRREDGCNLHYCKLFGRIQ